MRLNEEGMRDRQGTPGFGNATQNARPRAGDAPIIAGRLSSGGDYVPAASATVTSGRGVVEGSV